MNIEARYYYGVLLNKMGDKIESHYQFSIVDTIAKSKALNRQTLDSEEKDFVEKARQKLK